MLYPQNGSIAIGSKRSSPTWPAAAAVVSALIVAPRNTPCCQSNASRTSGTTVARRPPNRIASIGTPAGSCHSGAIDGHCEAGVVKRAFGWAAGVSGAGVQSLPFQSMACAGGSGVIPSHQMSPSSVCAQLVKIVFASIVCDRVRVRLVARAGATPKKPASGLMAYRRPSSPNFIHAMSSPIVSTFQPAKLGTSIARLVLPRGARERAREVLGLPSGEVSLMISMCSASQPSSRAMTEAMRRAKHFLPSSALPP